MSDNENGRWVVDPDDPAFEIWEPATVETAVAVVEKVDENPSSGSPIGGVWSDGRGPSNRCKAHRKNGEQCKRSAIAGGTVCRMHGGAAPHVARAARARLANAADRMARELLNIATDDDAPKAVKLAAIKDALDRANVTGKQTVEVAVQMPAFEKILGGMRTDSRAARGQVDDADADPALAWVADELAELASEDAALGDVLDVEVEVVEVEEVAPEPKPSGAGSGLLSMEDALAQLHDAPQASAPPAPRRR